MEVDDVRIEKVKNGFTVMVSYEGKDEKGEDKWSNEKFIYEDIDNAIAKVTEVFESK